MWKLENMEIIRRDTERERERERSIGGGGEKRENTRDKKIIFT